MGIFKQVAEQQKTGGVFKRISEQPKEKSISQKVLGTAESFLKGAGKGVLSTSVGISSLAEKGLTKIMPKSLENVFGIGGQQTIAQQLIPEQYRTPQGTAEKVGFGAEQIAEFLIPSTKIAKAEKLATGVIKGTGLLSKVGKVAVRSGIEVGVVGGQRALQKGDIDNDVKTTVIVAGLFPVAGAVYSGIKQSFLTKIGQKIQATVIRPTAKDLQNGFSISNVNKYKVGGSLKDTITKTHIKLNDLSNQLSAKLKESNVSLKLNNVYQETADTLSKSKTQNFGDIGAVNRVLKNLQGEITEVAGKNGLVDLVEANAIKRGAGTKGAWSFGRFEPDANATELVYDTFYNKLKTAIEKAVPEGEIKFINKQMSELIPISNAALRRLPVEQRNNVISLTDSIGLFASIFDPKALALIGANRLSKSGKFGQFLINVAQKQSKTSIGKRIFGQ